MNEELIRQVEELGLSNKEARVYIANLMLGPAGVQQIADSSGIKRVTTYVILESLVNLGLVSQTAHTKKTVFNAEAPENLRRLLKKREESLKEQMTQLDDLLPELGKLKTLSKDAPTVKFYDSAEGIRTVMQSVISHARSKGIKRIYGVSNLDQLYSFFPQNAAIGGNPDRVAAGIASKYLYTYQDKNVNVGSDKELNRESRYIPFEKYPIQGDMTIVGDTVTLLSLSGTRPVGVVIQSADLSKSMHTVFELAWEGAQKFNS